MQIDPALAAAPLQAASALPTAGSFVSMMASLALVLGAIFVLAWMARALQRARGTSSGVMQLHAGLQVGPKERVVLVQVGGEHFMVGVAPGCVTLLHKFMVAPVAPEVRGTVVPFAEKLRQVLKQREAA
jgi:flagellar protein FliO/FliZ